MSKEEGSASAGRSILAASLNTLAKRKGCFNFKPPRVTLVFLDGKQISQVELDKPDPKQIESMNVMRGDVALQAFGADVADGAVLGITKRNKNSAAVRDFMRKYAIVLRPASPKMQRITQLVTSGQGLSATDLQGRLLLVNGQEAAVEKSEVAEGQLQAVFVMDAEQAPEKYGRKPAKGPSLSRPNSPKRKKSKFAQQPVVQPGNRNSRGGPLRYAVLITAGLFTADDAVLKYDERKNGLIFVFAKDHAK